MSNAADNGSTKVVQTELPIEDYQLFRAVAEEHGLSLKGALEEAARTWVEGQQQVDPDDPLFETIKQIDSESPVGEPTTTADMEDDLYGEWRDPENEDTADDEDSEVVT